MPFKPGQSGNPRGNGGKCGLSTRERSRLIAQSEVKPLTVLMDTLAERWHAAQAEKDPATRKALQNEACAVAREVAPYLHPKLSTTMVRGDGLANVSFVLNLPAPDELKKLVRGPDSDQD